VSGHEVIPSVRVSDLGSALAFYRDILGFHIERGSSDDSNVSLRRGDARLMLESAADHYGAAYNAEIRERLGTKSPHALYIEAEDLDELYGRVTSGAVRVVDPLGERAWGQSEFTVEDGEGSWLTFWRADAS